MRIETYIDKIIAGLTLISQSKVEFMYALSCVLSGNVFLGANTKQEPDFCNSQVGQINFS